MDNPFIKDGNLMPIASINSVFVDDDLAYDLFRPVLMEEYIIKHKDELYISPTSQTTVLQQFDEMLSSEIESVRELAHSIANEFGTRLARILSTLFNPSKRSIKNRKDWTQKHWDYWKTIKHLYLLGGVITPHLMRIYYECIEREFQAQKINDVNISLLQLSQNMCVTGLAKLVNDKEALLFDFGQTNVKRMFIVKRAKETLIQSILPALETKHLMHKGATKEEMNHLAHILDEYIHEVIVKTAEEVGFKGNTLKIAIANYVQNGMIYPYRGGYGKLHLVSPNYANYLQEKLSKRMGRNIELLLYHDTSAMGLHFAGQPNTAVISVGTAFGVAFPENL